MKDGVIVPMTLQEYCAASKPPRPSELVTLDGDFYDDDYMEDDDNDTNDDEFAYDDEEEDSGHGDS